MYFMKKALFITIIAVLGFLPMAPALAYSSGYYTFRNTVTGSGIHNAGNNVYEIVGQKNSFRTDENVYFLTRIFNITHVGHFKFKHVVSGGSYYKEIYSHDFWPNRNWWAEVYYYNSINGLSAGNYELKTYISVDNEAYRYLDTRTFSVAVDYYNNNYGNPYGYDYNYQPDYYNYQYQAANYYDSENYQFKWLKTGKGVRNYDSYKYEIVNETDYFSASEDLYSLVYLSNIKNADRFQVKFELYRNGNFYKRNEVPTAYPRNQFWEYNYSWANLGKVPNGEYEIRAYISLNGGSFRHLTSRKIQVGYGGGDYGQDCAYGCPSYHGIKQIAYKYNWSKFDTNVKFLGNYIYDVNADRNIFYTDENVKVLTRIYDIRNIEYFQIRHKLYRNDALKQTKTSDKRQPAGQYWKYNYYDSDFGRLEAGDYTVKAYISVEGGSYKILGERNFTVKTRYAYSNKPYQDHYDYYNKPTYVYGGTIVGSSGPSKYYGSDNSGQYYNYPGYNYY